MPSIRRRGETLQGREALDIINQPESETNVIVNSASPGVVSPVAGLPADLVNAPVGLDDDLAHALAARPSRRRLPGITAFLGAAVLVSGGFLGGVLTQKHEGGASSGTGNAASLAAAFGRNRSGAGTTGAGTTGTGATGTGTTGTGAAGAKAGGGAAGGGIAGGAGGGATIGTVKLVDGSTVYVTTTDGSIVKVTTSKATTIKVTKDGTAEDLAPGTAVVVQGTAGADGVVKATTVTQGGGAGGFGGGGFGGLGGRTRTGTGGTGTGGAAGGGAPQQGAGN